MTHASPNQSIRSTASIIDQSQSLASRHYENFPVASVFLPRHLRGPIALIYSFARQADDFADEGDLSIEERLGLLDDFREQLDLLQAYINPKREFFLVLGKMIRSKKLPLSPFYDLLNAFSQDVVKTRYANYDEVLAYCAQSANPIGRLLLHLYGQASPENIKLSDHLCSALQLINFLQDIADDFKKNADKQRIYLCQDEMAKFGVTEQMIADQVVNANWQQLMRFNLDRTSRLLQAGKPLGRILKGRIGFEMRMIIAGGERIICKLDQVNGDIYQHRPTLQPLDWLRIFFKALLKG
ncbi:MAG: squalene synthase HpnC [Methylophilales bacterium]|nr:squalene synthase HpnC [Methylophilales bacterium]